MNAPERETAWFRDDCSCRAVSPDGDGCHLSVDYKTGLCAHCEGHSRVEERLRAMYRQAAEWITDVQMHYVLGPEATPDDVLAVAAEAERVREIVAEVHRRHHFNAPPSSCNECRTLGVGQPPRPVSVRASAVKP